MKKQDYLKKLNFLPPLFLRKRGWGSRP